MSDPVDLQTAREIALLRLALRPFAAKYRVRMLEDTPIIGITNGQCREAKEALEFSSGRDKRKSKK